MAKNKDENSLANITLRCEKSFKEMATKKAKNKGLGLSGYVRQLIVSDK